MGTHVAVARFVMYSGPERRNLAMRTVLSARLTAALSSPSLVLTIDEAQRMLGIARDASAFSSVSRRAGSFNRSAEVSTRQARSSAESHDRNDIDSRSSGLRIRSRAKVRLRGRGEVPDLSDGGCHSHGQLHQQWEMI